MYKYKHITCTIFYVFIELFGIAFENLCRFWLSYRYLGTTNTTVKLHNFLKNDTTITTTQH